MFKSLAIVAALSTAALAAPATQSAPSFGGPTGGPHPRPLFEVDVYASRFCDTTNGQAEDTFYTYNTDECVKVTTDNNSFKPYSIGSTADFIAYADNECSDVISHNGASANGECFETQSLGSFKIVTTSSG